MFFKITFIFFDNGTWYLFARKMPVWVGVKVGGMFIYLCIFWKLTTCVTYHLQSIILLVTATTEYFSTCWSPCQLVTWNYLACMAHNIEVLHKKTVSHMKKTDSDRKHVANLHLEPQQRNVITGLINPQQ